MRLFIAHEWRIPKIMMVLLALELPLTVANLTLAGIADPNTYRTKLWQNGSDEGFNSDPSEILYSYANYRPISVPMVWSQYMTTFNVIISVFSMFVLLVKSLLFILHLFIPALSVVVHVTLVALYCVSIYNQTASDMSDLNKPSPGMPWYLSKGCSHAEPGNYGYCMQARAQFGVVVVLTALFVASLAYSLWNVFPTEKEKVQRYKNRQSDLEMKKIINFDDGMTKTERRERNRELFLNLPKTPNTPGFGALNPMTPRTHAFAQLNGAAGPSNRPAAAPSSTLPLRQYYDAQRGGPSAQ